MALAPGTRLGVYEVTALIGEGGMGQVYRATDTMLGREVAIKLLPEAFAADPERLARFEREAKTLASLNHPHIAAIYGFEKSAPSTGSGPAGQHALVMELVEGDDLSVLIAGSGLEARASGPAGGSSLEIQAPRASGPKPRALDLSDALSIAKQVADALEAAHAQGIIHRDLKPANIKVRPDGAVKVLDFGLAKALDRPGAASASASMSPTITSPAMTQAGMILGTAAYMAPEQARGRTVDKRADIWAFGAVLFEMLTGARAFPGEDITDTLAAVVRAEPEWALLPASVSPTLTVFLKRCLQKDPRQRVGDIHDVRLALDGAFDVAAPPAPALPTPAARPSRFAWILVGAAMLVALALSVPALRHLTEITPDAPLVQLAVPLPADADVGFVELSPDGHRLALQLYRDGKLQMYVRTLDSPELRPLAGTDNGRTPFWSHDSRFIAFFAEGALKVISAAGGPTRVLCTETGLGGGGTWSKDDVILFAGNGPLRRVAATGDGAPCTTVGQADAKAQPRFPVFLPDGNHFLYTDGIAGDVASRGIYVAALDDPTPHRILADRSGVVYAPPAAGGQKAHLLFLRDTTLMAQAFDEASRAVVGDPVPVASDVATTFSAPQVAAAASNTTLVYVAGASNESQLTWLDREGKPAGTVGPQGIHTGITLSPDGTMVVTSRRESDGATSRWLYDIARGAESRYLPSETPGTSSVWLPDASRVLFGMPTAAATRGVYQKDPRGGGAPDLVLPLPAGSSFVPSSLSKDGRFLVYTSVDSKTQADVWVMPWTAKPDPGQAVKLVGTSAIESQGQVSPDGRWIAYTSNETGESVVYIRPLSGGPNVWRVDRGGEPRWNANGMTLYFKRALDRQRNELLAAAIDVDRAGNVHAGASKRLFAYAAMGFVAQSNIWSYAPHPDDQRFLVNTLTKADEQTVLTVVTNWQKAIAGR